MGSGSASRQHRSPADTHHGDSGHPDWHAPEHANEVFQVIRMSIDKDNSPPDSDAQNTTEAPQGVFNLILTGGGEFGNRFLALILQHLISSGVVTATKSPVGEVSLETVADEVNLAAHSLDVDFTVADELTYVIDDPTLLQYVQTNLLTLIGGGAGREWRRMLGYFEEYSELDEFLTEAVTAEPHTHFQMAFAGLTGATGMGKLRRQLDRIRNGDLPAPSQHPGVFLPVTVGPSLRIHDQYVNAIDPDQQRRAFENLYEHLPFLRHAIQDGIASGQVFADNALLSLLERTHRQRVPFSDLKRLQVPIRTDDNWRPFIENYRFSDAYDPVADNGSRNDALARSLLFPLYAGIRPPELYFDQGDAHFDRNDYFGELEGVSWLPGHLWLDNITDIGGLVPDFGQPASVEDTFYPAARYATYTTPGGFNLDSVERALVFAHVRDGSLSSRAHGTISRTVADELDILPADVSTTEITGLEPRHFPVSTDPELALNVMVGVNDLEVSYRELGKQTLDGGA